MDVYVPSAKESCRYYDQAQFSALSLKSRIEALYKVFRVMLLVYGLCIKYTSLIFPRFCTNYLLSNRN